MFSGPIAARTPPKRSGPEGASCRRPTKSFTLSFGASQRKVPESEPSRKARSGPLSASARKSATCGSASRSLVSDSPSSGLVLTHAEPASGPAPSSSMSAGMPLRLGMRTTSPTRTSSHVSVCHCGLPRPCVGSNEGSENEERPEDTCVSAGTSAGCASAWRHGANGRLASIGRAPVPWSTSTGCELVSASAR
eukprot:scaffold57429_cov27-Tisochrysis_lutea.AAC.9